MRRSGSGFTILEAVIAMFVLVVAAILSGQMLQISLRASGTVRDESLALQLAQRKLKEIGEWSRTRGAGGQLCFNGPWPDGTDSPSAPPFLPQPDAQNGRFVVGATSLGASNPTGRHAIYSPARDLPAAVRLPAASPSPVAMSRSARVVKVTVTWGTSRGALRPRVISVVGLVPEPPRRLTEIRLDSEGGTLGATPVTLHAEGRDELGPVPDLVYRWDVLPLNGNLTLRPQVTDASTVRVSNKIRYPDGVYRCTGGRCRVRVRATCSGQEVSREIVFDMGSPP